MINIQNQPLRCVTIFKKLQAIIQTLAKPLEKNFEDVPIHLVKLKIISSQLKGTLTQI